MIEQNKWEGGGDNDAEYFLFDRTGDKNVVLK
jgi:hypothetical protein